MVEQKPTPEQQVNSSPSPQEIAKHETVNSPFNKHQEIVGKTVDVEVLAINESNIGSIKVDYIGDMSVVPMASRVGIEADFHNIESLASATPENFNSFKQKVATAPEYDPLRETLTRLSPEQQELELMVFFAAGLAVEYFGKDDSGSYTAEEVTEMKLQRDRTYLESYAIDASRKDSLKVKPLSAAGKDAMCTEYAIFVKEALRRLGKDFSYIAAEKQGWPDDPSFYHSFLVSPDGKTLIDPLDTAQYFHKGLSFGVYTLPESLFESTKPIVATESWTGNTRAYALSHIEVPPARAA